MLMPISCLQQLWGIVKLQHHQQIISKWKFGCVPVVHGESVQQCSCRMLSVSQQQQQMKTENIFYLLVERAFHSNTKHRWKKWYQLLFKCVVISAFIHEKRFLISSVFYTFGFQTHSCVSLEALLIIKLLTWIGLRAKLFVTPLKTKACEFKQWWWIVVPCAWILTVQVAFRWSRELF